MNFVSRVEDLGSPFLFSLCIPHRRGVSSSRGPRVHLSSFRTRRNERRYILYSGTEYENDAYCHENSFLFIDYKFAISSISFRIKRTDYEQYMCANVVGEYYSLRVLCLSVNSHHDLWNNTQ